MLMDFLKNFAMDNTNTMKVVSINTLFEHTRAYAWWALMHRFLSVVCDLTKIHTRH